jgi:hypothetical protein
LGNEDNAFLEAWNLNVKNQNLILINNNTLAQLVIGYVFNDHPEIAFEIEPQELLRDLRFYAVNHQIDYDKYLEHHWRVIGKYERIMQMNWRLHIWAR